MITRLWRTEVDPTRLDEYDTFAQGESLPMFRQQQGFLGALFLRSGTQACVITLWQDEHAVDGLTNSASYQGTVRRIIDSGLLVGGASLEVFDTQMATFEPGVARHAP